MRKVTVLTKADCDLCEHAKAVLERVRADLPLDVETLSIDSDEGRDLAQRCRVLFPPGVLIDGQPFSYGRLSERKLRRALRC